MMIKVGNEYLDFDGDIEIERQAKLFNSIAENNGDYSYEFQIPDTTHNRSKLVIQDINIANKIIYNNCDAQLYTNTGTLIYSGFLKVTRINNGIIYTSFFSGNTNWLNLLPSLLKEIDFSNYNVKFKDTLTAPSITEVTDGVIFPFIDAGLLETRATECLVYDDFVPWIYVKSVVKKIFNSVSIKLDGDILNDPIYNRLIITSGNNEWFQGFIDDRTISVSKDATQNIATSTMTVVTFNDDTYPQFIGQNNNYSISTSRFTADVDMTVEVDVFLTTDDLFTADSLLFKNGVSITNSYRHTSRTVGTDYTFHYDKIPMLAGDYIDIRMRPLSNANIFTGSYLKIKPVKFANVYANAILPDQSVKTFLTSIFQLFNTIIDYDPFSKTASINLFKNISKRPEQDLSEFITDDVTIDFYELIDDYAIKNLFTYSSTDTDRAKDYRRRNVTDFGNGDITLDNKYILPEAEVIKSDLIAGLNYDNGVFKNILQIPLLTYSEVGNDITISSVTDVSGVARFNCSAAHDLSIGDIVRISDLDDYNESEGVVTSLPSTSQFVIYNLTYTGSSTGKAKRLKISLSDIEPSIALVNTRTSSSGIGLTNYAINNEVSTSVFTELNYAWFQKKQTGFTIDSVLGDLSFGDISLQGYTVKVNMIDNYFKEFKDILSDPIVCTAGFRLPEKVFINLLFSRPVKIKSLDINGLFYMDRITGYINSVKSCLIRLIKLP